MTTVPDIHSLIPHAGLMCLLDAVDTFDHNRIICRASSHRDPANPLRHRGQLSIQTGVEYAAQAVAVHGGLLARQGGQDATPRHGMIAVLTNVSWHTDQLDAVTADLMVLTEKLADLPQGLSYRFNISADDKILLEGELIIALHNIAPSGSSS